jgi:succinate-semialdehyde dehydrogenase/glutarate-semialdehyde dehydrogenase
VGDWRDRLKDKSLLREQCFVDGEFRGEPVMEVTNPANGEMLARVPAWGAAETVEAVEAAGRAFAEWSGKTGKERATVLRRWYEAIVAAREDLAVILTSEQGKPLAEARGEIEYAASYVEFYSEQAKRISGEILGSHRRDARILVLRQAAGVVAAITPWNFPAAMITRKVAPALAAGCTVVVKPAEETPLTALALAELARRAGFDAGVLNVITGAPEAIGGVLTSHPAVRVVGFTGSTEVGKLLMRQSASTVKRVLLELGGNAPFLVFDDADLDAAVEGAMAAKFRNLGQTCVCANRFYVQRGVAKEFSERLTAAVEKLQVGDGMEAGVTQGPLINDAAVAKVKEHVADAVGQGASVVTGGKTHALGGRFFEPTVMTNVTQTMRLTREETFGPVAAIVEFDAEDEAVKWANATEFGLAAYLYSRDLGRAWRVSEALEYGMVGVNTGLISTELAPFGGVKESGNSREGAHYGMEEFLELKYLLMAGLDS